MNPELFLYCVEDADDDICFVVSSSLSAALAKWKANVAAFMNEDFRSEGIDRKLSDDDINDPMSIYLVAEPGQLML